MGNRKVVMNFNCDELEFLLCPPHYCTIEEYAHLQKYKFGSIDNSFRKYTIYDYFEDLNFYMKHYGVNFLENHKEEEDGSQSDKIETN